jgi:predicted CopG family antitoxin
MQQIDIDFEVYKALTALRESEYHTYNEILRDLLRLKKTTSRKLTEALSGVVNSVGPQGQNGLVIGGRFLPHGTMLQAKYKGTLYSSIIEDGEWHGPFSTKHKSASSAAKAVTGTNVNGLNFWNAKRPMDNSWQKLSTLPKISK